MIAYLLSLIPALVGLGFVLFLLHTIYSRDAKHWRYLADCYGGNWRKPQAEKWGHLILYGKYPLSKGYNNSFKIGVHREGMSLRMIIPPDSFYCERLFIPFKDIKGWSQSWYINAKSVELELENAPDVKLVMPKSQIEWVKRLGGTDIDVRDIPSPNKDKPLLWHAFMVFWPIYVIGGLTVIGLLELFS